MRRSYDVAAHHYPLAAINTFTMMQLWLIALVAFVLGCAKDFELQDDPFANVTVVDNSIDDPKLVTFTLAAKATVHTGARNDSKLEQELWNIVDAVMTTDHSLVVSMSNGKVIRQFDSTSTFVRTISRAGEGPGEFKHAARLILTEGDSLLLFDYMSGRITTFTSLGAVVDVTMIQMPRSHSFLGVMCCFNDGAYIARTRPQQKGRVN